MSKAFLFGPVLGTAAVISATVWDLMSEQLAPTIVLAASAMWAIGSAEYRTWKMQKEIAPRLALKFDMDAGPPYVSDKPTVRTLPNGEQIPSGGMRIHSVGIVNRGQETALGVRVKLVKIEPPECEPYWNMPLHVANEPTDIDTCDVHHTAGGYPTNFYELFSQYRDTPNGPTTSLRLRVSGIKFDKLQLSLREKYFLTLVIDGPRVEGPRRFVLQRNETGQYEMRPAITP